MKIVALSAMLLLGCANAPTEDQLAQKYGRVCQFGAPAGTDAWRACIYGSAGIKPPETLEQQLGRLYGERCALAGYQPGTGAYGQCLLANADRDRAMALQLLQSGYGQVQIPKASLPIPSTVTCTSIVGNTIVTTSCR